MTGGMNGLRWSWIALQIVVPSIVGALAAWPFWRKGQSIFGNLAGSAVMFGTAFALIMREYVEIDRAVAACLEQGYTCFPQPSAFTRFAIYASIGMIEVIALFTISLAAEGRYRRRGYDPQWR
jgi:hypothetical protein